ncbi:MAG: phosphomannomutase/phosphoglucomutase [Holosporales bacterium]|jgi:phosphomannomutase|nr:phosphomannomutase/phosphoglucomutase [Holosporales bacterium]
MPTGPYRFCPSLLRAYDIRGVVGETLTETDAYYVGRALATFLQPRARPVAVGRDGRLSSPMLEAALICGLQESGCTVWSIGLSSTPLLYYTVIDQACAGGVMVTGSHNPANYNGFKMMRGSSALFGQEILTIGDIAAAGNFTNGKGRVVQYAPKAAYIARLLEDMSFSPELRIVWDTGNGAVGPILQDLIERFPCFSLVINAQVDGHFPAHPPDPSCPEHLQEMCSLVRQEKCSIGIAFDGDGDRLGVVDECGNSVSTDHLLMLFAKDVLARHPNATIIADIKTSQTFFDEVKRWGGYPVMVKTGHSIIKTCLQKTGALFAGEISGHLFFADTWYGFDDGLYASLRLLSLLSQHKEPLSALVHTLPPLYTMPEQYIPCTEARKKIVLDRVIRRLQQEGVNFVTIDGVRVMTAHGWWLLRASNTQDCLTTRAEGFSHEGLAFVQKDLQQYLGYGLGGTLEESASYA